MSKHRDPRQVWSRIARHPALATVLMGVLAACGSHRESEMELGSTSLPISGVAGPTSVTTPIGLAVEVDGGAGVPLKVRAGQTFFLNQIDLRFDYFSVRNDLRRVLGLDASLTGQGR